MHYDHEPPHPRHTGHRWVDFVIAGSALLISVVSLVVAVRHGQTMEEMAHANARLVEANSWPFVGAGVSRGDGSATIFIRNAGVGPAKVHWVEVKYDGVAQSSLPQLLAHCCGLPSAPGAKPRLSYENSLVANSVLRPGEVVPMVVLSRAQTDPAVFDAFYRRLLRIGFRVCYCSVFDECFIGDGGHLDVQKTADCAKPAVNFGE
jgi:hypothetical protein